MMSAPKQEGFTILLAALVATLVLALGVSVFSIAQKQVVLSSLGRSSQYAFYTADTAAECALYWDVRFQHFPTTTATAVGQIQCDGDDIDVDVVEESGVIVSDFEYSPNGYCAKVRIEKDPTVNETRIEADGFSTDCFDIETSSRALQRSVELNY